MIDRKNDSVVDGELFFLTPSTYEATLSGCDQLEELPSGSLTGHEYRRIAARVQTDSGEIVAWVYACSDAESDSDLLPLIEAEQQRIESL